MSNYTLIFDDATVSPIVQYLDTALLVLLVLVCAVLAIAFIRGIFRGWKYGTYRLISFSLMIAVILATLTPNAAFVGGIDMSRFNLPAIQFNLNFDGADHAISAPWTTVQGTLEEIILQIADAMGAKGSSSALLAYSSVLATSFIKLLLIFVWGLIISTLGALLVMLLWHIAFKRIIPKHRRKIKKLRIVSALEEALVAAACLGMLLSPWTGIANALSSNFKVDEGKEKENETVSMMTEMLGVYRESAFAKTFFAWNSMDGSSTFDQEILSFLTESNVGDLKTDIYSEISSLASLSSDIVNSGLLSAFSSEGIRWYLLLSSTSIPGLINSLSESDLFRSVLPFAVAVATNLSSVKEALGEETVQYLSSDSVNWTDEIKNLSKIYQHILDSGIIDCVVDETSSTPKFDLTQLKYVLTGKDPSGHDTDSREAIAELASSIDDSSLYNHLLAGLLCELSKKETPSEDAFLISDFLPKNGAGEISYSDLASLSYGKEFLLLFDCLTQISDISPELIDGAFALLDGEERTQDELVQEYRRLGALAAAKAEEFTPLFVGKRDANGMPLDDSPSCLLDSSFLQNALPKTLPLFEKIAGDSLNLELDLSQSKGEIQTVKDFKKEFGAILDVASTFAQTEEGLDFIENGTGISFDEKGNLVQIDPSLVKVVQSSLEKIDSSLLLSEALPQVAEHYLDQFAGNLEEYGIQTLDFRCENFGHELSKLLDLVGTSGNLLLSLSSLGSSSPATSAELLLQEKETILRILDTFASSKILNPEIDGKKNQNLVSLLNSVFASAGLEGFEISGEDFDSIKFENDRLADGSYPVSEGQIVANGENGRIVDVLFDIVGSVSISSLLSLSGASASEAIRTLSQIDVTALFRDIGESKVLSPIAGRALDVYFAPVLGYDSSLDVPTDKLSEEIGFANVSDWEKEGAITQKLLDLAARGIDLSSFDLNSVSPSTLTRLFSALAESQIFTKTDEEGNSAYVFPKYFSSKLLSMADSSTLPYFLDQGKTVSPSASLEAKREAASAFVDSCLSLSEPADWVGEGREIETFGKILSDLQALGGAAGFSSFRRSKLPVMEKALQDLSSSACLGQVMIANALEKSFASLPDNDAVDFSLINSSLFFEPAYSQEEARKEETQAFCELLDVLFDPSYGVLDENASFVESRLDLSELSVPYLLRPLLEGASSSKLLSTPKQGERKAFLASVLEGVLVKSGLYGSGEGFDASTVFAPEHSSFTIEQVVASCDDIDGEISLLCEVFQTVQDSSLLSGGSLDLASVGEESSSLVSGLFSAMNSSKLLYRSLPIQLEKALSSLDGSSSLKEDLGLADPFFTQKSDRSDYLPYPESEAECLASILGKSSALASLDFSSLSSLEALDPISVLSPLYASGIFNSTPAGSGDKEGFTSAQAVLIDVLGNEGLSSLLYSPSSPKDKALGIASGQQKAAYLVSHYLGKGEAGDYTRYPLSLQTQAGNSFHEILGKGESGLSTALDGLAYSGLLKEVEDGSVDLSSLSSEAIAKLLKVLSHCALLRDSSINSLSSALSSSYSVEGIDFSLANVYYPYFYQSNGSKRSEPDFDAGYDDGEIDLLAVLLSSLDQAKKSLETDQLSSMDPYLIRSLLFEMSDSLLFHQTGPNLHSPSYGLGYSTGSYLPSEEGASPASDLTVFEQVMFLLCNKSGLSENAFSPYRDFPLLYRYGNDLSLASRVKVHDRIKAFSSSWKEEISCLTTDDLATSGLLCLAKKAGFTTEDGTQIAATPSLMKKLSPKKLSAFLSVLSQSEICEDALPRTLSRFLTSGNEDSKGLGMDSFSARLEGLGLSSVFLSDSSFLQELVPYDTVSFFSSSYSGGETYSILGDLDGDGVYEADLSSYASSEYSSSTWSFRVSSLGCPFEIELSAPGQVSYLFDTARYYLPQKEFAPEGASMKAIRLFLSSLYSSEGEGGYYSFADNPSLEEALNRGVSLYGITSLIYDSGFYSSASYSSSFKPVDEGGAFTARSYAAYKMMSLSCEIAGSSVSVHLLDAVDAPALQERYGDNAPLHAHLSSIESLLAGGVDSFAEAAFLQKAMPGGAISQAIGEAAKQIASSPSSEAAPLYRYLSSLLCSFSDSEGKGYGDYYADFLSSSTLSYSFLIDSGEGDVQTIAKEGASSVYASSLLAGALKSRAEERLAYVNLSKHAAGALSLSSPTKDESEFPRSSFLPAEAKGILDSFDPYGYASSSYSYPNLLQRAELEISSRKAEALLSKGISFSSSSVSLPSSLDEALLSKQEKQSLLALGEAFDSLSGTEEALIKLAYLSDFYDFFVCKGSVSSALGREGYFHEGTSSLPASDFPSPYQSGILEGTETPFTFLDAFSTVLEAL